MVTRRVQLTGKSTYIVSLPKDWARLNNVKAGSELHLIQEDDGGLRINSSLEALKQKTAEISLEGKKENEIRREFISKYIGGYSIIKFTSQQRIAPETRRNINNEVSRLIGLEVVEEESLFITVQDFFSTENLSIEKAVKRAYAITVNMHENLINALEKEKKTLSIASQDDEVDRVFFLVLRQLGIALENASFLKALNLKSSDCIPFTRLITALERIADNIAKQANEADKAKPDKELAELNSQALEVYSNAVKAFFSSNKTLANQALEQKELLVEKCEQAKAKSKAAAENNLLIDKVASIAEHAAEIAEIAIDKEK